MGKEVKFTWGDEQEQSFQTLKQQLTDFTLLKTPTDDGLYRVYTDYSSDAVGAALHQV